MSSYKVTVSNNNIKVDTTTVKHETKVTTPEYATSLSRVGGQGSKGDSVTGALLNTDADLIITITRADGTTYDINAGNLEAVIELGDIPAFELGTLAEGEIFIYDGTAEKWKNHQLTTSKVLDIDNTGKTDGAVLLYDGTSNKYKATTQLNNANTFMIGGSF
jgi:hypothetical protein